MTLTEFSIRLLAAFALGILIGIERQRRQRMAGIRTNALVSAGAAMFVLLPAFSSRDGSTVSTVAAQVVSGIGFLGAGVIIRDGLNIRGLNTAATLWCAAGVGVLCGSGHLLPAAVGACIVLLANLVLRPLARSIDPTRSQEKDITVRYVVRAICHADAETRVRSNLLNEALQQGLRIRAVQSEDADTSLRIEVCADLLSEGQNDKAVEQIVAHVSMDHSVSAVRWEVAGETSQDPQTLIEDLAESDRGGLLR